MYVDTFQVKLKAVVHRGRFDVVAGRSKVFTEHLNGGFQKIFSVEGGGGIGSNAIPFIWRVWNTSKYPTLNAENSAVQYFSH